MKINLLLFYFFVFIAVNKLKQLSSEIMSDLSDTLLLNSNHQFSILLLDIIILFGIHKRSASFTFCQNPIFLSSTTTELHAFSNFSANSFALLSFQSIEII